MRLKLATVVVAPVAAFALTPSVFADKASHKTKEVVAISTRNTVSPRLLELIREDQTTTTSTTSTTIAPKPRAVRQAIPTTIPHPVVHMAQAPAQSAGWSWPWSCIAHYESGGNPADNTGNGYYGGLQFALSTWQKHGGVGMPNQASIAEQEAVANNVVTADHGSYREWPNTARDCGLPVF